jgi:hypothetical protein
VHDIHTPTMSSMHKKGTQTDTPTWIGPPPLYVIYIFVIFACITHFFLLPISRLVGAVCILIVEAGPVQCLTFRVMKLLLLERKHTNTPFPFSKCGMKTHCLQRVMHISHIDRFRVTYILITHSHTDTQVDAYAPFILL